MWFYLEIKPLQRWCRLVMPQGMILNPMQRWPLQLRKRTRNSYVTAKWEGLRRHQCCCRVHTGLSTSVTLRKPISIVEAFLLKLCYCGSLERLAQVETAWRQICFIHFFFTITNWQISHQGYSTPKLTSKPWHLGFIKLLQIRKERQSLQRRCGNDVTCGGVWKMQIRKNISSPWQ